MPLSSFAVLLRPCLDDRGDHVGAALQPAVRLAEHGVGFAHAGGRAQIDPQLPALGGHMLNHPPVGRKDRAKIGEEQRHGRVPGGPGNYHPAGLSDALRCRCTRIERTHMADLVLVLTVMAFAGLCLLYVRGCERIIRRDEIGETTVELTRAPAEWR